MSKLTRDEFIASLYATASEPDALARISLILQAYFDVDSAGVWMLQNGNITEISLTPDIVESVPPYLSYYCNLDPWAVARRSPRQAYIGNESVDEAKFIDCEFYRDFARHYGMLRPMGIVLPLDEQTMATVALNRISKVSLLDQGDKALLQDVELHLKAALQLHARFLVGRKELAARTAALDLAKFGIVICDADAVIHFANRSADQMMADGAFKLSRIRGLVVGTAQQTKVLHDKIRAAANGQPETLRCRTSDDSDDLSILITPMQADGCRRALVSLTRDRDVPGPTRETLMQLFDLSRGQAELCRLLLQGRTFEEAARERQIATSTARSYFMIILARTGAKNLRDLLRLLSSIPYMEQKTL